MSRRTRTLVALVLGGLLTLEVGLRIFTSRNSQWNARLGANKQFDPLTHFRLKPHYDFGSGVVTNEYGYLAPTNLSFARPAGALRLLYVGDSATHLPVYTNYPRQVEEILEREGVGVETINAAVPGFASENALALFESELSRFDADFCFVYLGWNDLGQYGPEGLSYKKHEAGYAISPVQRALSSFYTPRLVFAFALFLRRFTPTTNDPLTAEESALYEGYTPRHYDENLRRLLGLARPRYPHIFVLNLATLTNEDPTADELRRAHFPTGMNKNMRKLHRLVGKYNEVVERVAREEGVPMLDLYAAFDSHEARLEFTDSAHMTPAGARRIAELVLRAIRASGALPARPERGAGG
jgi:lysophospholipase L1-like esterase